MEILMRKTFKVGNKTTRRFKIDVSKTISVAGGNFNVYATPEMIRDIERTCKDYILEHADANEDSVGTQVNISHVGATLMGMSVEISVLLKSIDRRRVVFEITVNDDFDLVGHGTHERFITDSVKSTERLSQKAQKAGLLK